MLFDVRVVDHGPWEVLNLLGDLDLATVPFVRQALDRLDSRQVALDLSGLGYLDPVGLGLVLLGSLRATRSGGRFAVISPPGPARDLLAETRLDTILEVVAGRDELSA